VPVSELRVNPLNGRRKLTDIDAMADSIRAVGILEPLVLAPADDGLLIVFGHRRHAGAEHAGLTTVPAIIRTDLDEARVLQAAIIENTQRANLTPTEEAEQLRRLMDLRTLTVTDLAAAVGRGPAYVTGRLALLTLPDRARDALDAGSITLEVAGRLTDLADHPELIDELIDPDGHIDPDLLDAACTRVAVEREAVRLAEEAAAKGLRLVDLQPGHRHLATLDLTRGQAGAHRRQACHAVILDRSYGKPRLVPICTQPDRHQPATPPAPADGARRSAGGRAGTTDRSPAGQAGDVESAVGSREPDGGARRAAWRAEADERDRQARDAERNRRRVAKARRAFLTDLMGKRIKRADAAVFVFAGVLDRASQTDLAAASAVLGLTAQPDRWGQKDWRAAVAGYAGTDGDHMVKAAFATACGWAENHISPHAGYDARAAAYIAVLVALGYTPDPYETEQIDAYQQRHADHREPDQPEDAEPDQPTAANDTNDTDRPDQQQ